MNGSFTTTFDTLGAPNPFLTGTGTMVTTIGGTPVTYTAIGAMAGWNPDPASPGALTQVVGWRADGTLDVIMVLVDPALYVPGATIPVDWGSAFGGMWNFDPSTGTVTLVGLLFNGSVHFDEAGATPGAAVSGTYQGELVTGL